MEKHRRMFMKRYAKIFVSCLLTFTMVFTSVQWSGIVIETTVVGAAETVPKEKKEVVEEICNKSGQQFRKSGRLISGEKVRRTMNQPVVIKGNKSGLIVHLDDKMEFPELKEKVEEKFASSSDFLAPAQIALSIEARKLTEEQQYEMKESDSQHSKL